jgi:hypothetical protein
MTNRLALALAVALAAPCAALAQANGYAPAPVYAPPQHQRDSWYIGFGVGPGVGNVTVDGVTRSFGQELRAHGTGSPVQFGVQFEVGATVRPDLLLGLDVRMLRAQATATDALGGNVDYGVSVGQFLAVTTWFPAQRGFFLRAGAGVAQVSLDSNLGGGVTANDHTGLGLLGGVGYAFWLGRHFNLTLNVDASAQSYGGGAGEPSSSRVLDGRLGFTWY